MKFGYFTHVWGGSGLTAGQRYETLWNEVELADRLGFDYAFSVEHHFSPEESWMPSPTIFCTGAALRTERIRLGPMGYIPPLYNPIRVVEEIAALDHVTGGRLDVGLTSGLMRSFFDPYGADFDRRRELTQECLELIRVALAADGPFSFEGAAHSYHDLTLSFGPVQRPHPPLWIPTRDRNMLRYLARIGAHTSSTMIVPRSALGLVYRHYVRWWQEAGHPGKPDIGYWTLVHVADDDEEAVERAAPHVIHTLTKVLGYGRNTSEPIGGGYGRRAALSTDDILRHAGDMNFLMEHNLVFAGSPATVADQIRRAAQEGCFNTLLGEFNFGSLDWRELSGSMRRFAEEVIPALADFEPY
ncbi:luciferase [Sphaerisporangium krabiense]|uniref:Alkanesulfonate monooxygenase SsuD/methylene tetrahydromethanopterin reductase-like flavin-dependent oxidoreductase (Luciferase family) n=1 Tax=Sphaerisporangium krabiense TaxID=763782 RepID=A0A7W8Z6J7_9ACTN|nr:LLM class flavin-dependent oxidoreductase [Sphaerisporangium krabiense]MBB5628437.1 alkanesulfonate monooxygenase SsuD/methylene tetrahydromethanopterin reductase-like flavin-dependent oxidoreductase (luciferase family) [Sphaerisporangium krabiense]GII66824.1 luciferase [Sphaerisporangium krabiense]